MTEFMKAFPSRNGFPGRMFRCPGLQKHAVGCRIKPWAYYML